MCIIAQWLCESFEIRRRREASILLVTQEGRMANYVVAGVTGRVGSTVASELLKHGERVTVIVRDEARGMDWARRGAEVARGSLDDRSFLSHAVRDTAGFFTLLPENVAPDDFHGARRRMADAIADAVQDSGVPHVVMLSAIAAVLPDGNGPAKDLHYCENQLRARSTTLTALRACYFQDNVASVLTPARQAGIYPNFLPSADVPIPMIATRDIGRLAASALTSPPPKSEVVDLFGPTYSVRQVAEHLGTALGTTLEIVNIPPEEHVTALMKAGMPQQIAEAVAEMFAAFSAGLLVPRGDRRLSGSTTIDKVIAECLRRHEAVELTAQT
jgi:uncharacterized protein YbjT (DUF2867 family)